MSKRSTRSNWLSVGLVSAAVSVLAWGAQGVGAQEQSGQGFSFKSAVDLVNVTATVTDSRGRFVPGLRAEDFTIFENGKRQTISQFDAERVPVSLGIVIDTSGSMQGEKMADAKAAVSRFVDLLGPQDEMFLYRFDSQPTLIQGWTDDRRALVRALNGIRPSGGTAMYDAVAEAVPLAASGTRRKKALVVISDGEDTNSTIPLREVQALIRESELLIYAIGIGGSGGSVYSPQTRTLPIPIPGGGRIEFPLPGRRAPTSRIPGGGSSGGVNEGALRTITDDSGGRTEIIGSSRDLDSVTAGIADELSQQYFLGYVSTLPKDGRWHTIDVQVRRGNYVRARKGYTAS